LEASSADPPMKPYLGLRLSSGGSGSRVRNVMADGPAYAAGILAGDEILTLDRRRLRPGDIEERLARRQPGDTITLHLLRREELLWFEIELAGRPDGKWSIRRVEEPTELQKAVHSDWLGHPWDSLPPAQSAGEERKTRETLSGKDS